METPNNQRNKLFFQSQRETEVSTKRKFNLFEFTEALEESPKSTPKKCRTHFPLSEKILCKRHSDGALRDLSGCKRWRQQNLDKDMRKDMLDKLIFSSSAIVKAMKMDEIDEFFTSATISFKPIEKRYDDAAAGFINKFTTSFAHILSKEYFDRTTFEDRRIFVPKQYSNEIYFDEEFVNKEKLGEGEFSEVYKCAIKKTGHKCVVKKSKVPFKSPLNRQERLEEVEIHYKVGKHQNIVELIGAWEQRGYLYLQTELCEKGSLATLIKDRKRSNRIFSEEEIWQIINSIKLAFTHLHGKSIIHLDVKPENILIKKMNCQNIYKLVDFGCATSIPPRKGFDKDGDRRYLSNDALNGTYSPGADWFSLGITILELTTLRRMEDNGEIYQRLRMEEILSGDINSHNCMNYYFSAHIIVLINYNPKIGDFISSSSTGYPLI
ncbi:membrane-associated tyrosine- and threonine-specific cdc2-inhibitory kinase [Rhizophagus clarus]|uniref:Membrane-associated tyrosine-and threonine-specific cdc2-inhibitory kinase n=1 Tax=Rhizophagus clarus TaxID=94130 RepID=A0A8H3LJU6_9GLOM|nr:membrane-associated tyrosine- and threonine-specific cdc2-inhibitory kinase [Rhizophagus clarus]